MIFTDADVLAKTYDMTAIIERYGSYEDEWGETKHGLKAVYSIVPCSIERATKRNLTHTPSKSNIEYDTKLLVRPEIITIAGDEIAVTYPNGQIREFIAGEPYYFASHNEIPLVREDEA